MRPAVLLLLCASLLTPQGLMRVQRRAASGGTVEVGQTSPLATDTPTNTGFIRCGQAWTAPNTGTIDKIFIYSINDISSTQHVKVGLFSGATASLTRIAAETDFDLSGAPWTVSWHEFSPVSYSVASGTTYRVCYELKDNGTWHDFTASLTDARAYNSNTYGTSWPSGTTAFTLDDVQYSIKARLSY